ncbi:MAG: hypothetical protein LBL59_03045 [Xanthomonadaceae bacterium]|jgi:hypothetical protein|nr:hypothetical protein [Xanthomonadaceae bacterium]
MNTTSDRNFDQTVQQLHTAALSELSPHTLSRLRDARQAATQSGHASTARHHRWGWLLGSACAVALSVTLGMQFLMPPAPSVNAPADGMSGQDGIGSYDLLMSLEDDPGFYVWLGSNDISSM